MTELKQFAINLKEITIDEIALEGLDGIVIDLLWRRIERRISTNLTPIFKCRVWNFILNNEEIRFYTLPSPNDRVEHMDRFTLVDENSGHFCDPPQPIDGPYEYHPINDEYGSCKHYNTRKLVKIHDLKKMTLDKVVCKYGDSLVLVASLAERWRALAPNLPLSDLENITIVHYCILELIGKSRYNGQVTVGNSNILKIIKDSKLLFYNRKHLQSMNLITTTAILVICGKRGIKGKLLRLNRFHLPMKVTIPRCGKLHDVVEYLESKPNYTATKDELLKNGVIKPLDVKKLKKINLFHVEDKPSDTVDEDYQTVSKKKPKKTVETSIKKLVTLVTESDESSDTDDEKTQIDPNIQPQSKVFVSIYRQAYELILKAGLRGVTQVEIGKYLGIEFYVSRNLCKIFKSRNIVREILEDRGRQRSTRYIAIAATGQDKKFNEEKQKMIAYLNETNVFNDSAPIAEPVPSTSNINNEPPNKRIKLNLEEESKENDGIIEIQMPEQNVTAYSELLKSKRGPTLRYLKYANGMLKVTREKVIVAGYQTLSNLVAKEIHESPMDTKAIRNLVQRLFVDGQLKLFKLKWPGHAQRYTNLICSPRLTSNHPIIKAKYKEICVRSYANKESIKKSTKPERPVSIHEPLKSLSYPRYMKLQKLHEFITKFVYFDDEQKLSHETVGVTSLVNMLPEMPVELAIGHISPSAMTGVYSLKLTDNLLKTKLREAPLYVYKLLLQSQSLRLCLKSNISILASFGLIQLCHKPVGFDNHSGLLKYVFYVNRNAKLVDTTGPWPREDADVSKLERKFYFETFEDVKAYWKSLFEISVNTIVVDRPKRDRQTIPVSPVYNLDVAAEYDIGVTYGDGRGPAGLDSNFFLEVRQSWERLHHITCRDTSHDTVLKIKKIKRETVKKIKQKKKRKVEKKVMMKKTVALKRKRMPDSVVKWNKSEDKMLMLIKSALTVMSPTSQPGCLTVRNLAARDILSIYDSHKTANACHKRINTLESNKILTHEKECLINELRRRPRLISKYEGLLKKIRQANPLNLNKYINEARVPTMELVWLLYQLYHSESYNRKRPCIAVSLEEFNSKYSISPSTVNKPYNLYRYSADNEIFIDTLKEGIVLALAMKSDSSDKKISEKVYSFIENYTEKSLRTAIDQLRKSGAVCIREKNLNNLFIRYSFQDIVNSKTSKYKATMSTYRMSAAYMRRMTSKLTSEFGDKLGEAITTELPNNTPATPETVCAQLESQLSDNITLITTTPPIVTGSTIRSSRLSFVDLETNFKLKIGATSFNKRKIFKTFSETLPKFDYKNILQLLVSDAMIYPSNTGGGVLDAMEYSDVDKITDYLRARRERGATFSEIQEHCNNDTKVLVDELEAMESNRVIKRVGFNENYLVLTEFTDVWSLPIEDHKIIPTPWLFLDGNINIGLFVKWSGAVLNKIYDYPAKSISSISDDCEYLTPRAVQDICNFLHRIECIKLKVLLWQEPNLFSDEYDEPVEEAYHKYASPKSVLAYPVNNCFSIFTYFKKLAAIDVNRT